MAAVCFLLLATRGFAISSEDAYINVGDSRWVMGTAAVERVLALVDGRLVTERFRNKVNGHELSTGEPTGPWKFVAATTAKLRQGELQLDLTLRRDALAVTKSYVVYPGSSIMREWTTWKNVGHAPVTLTDPAFFETSIRVGEARSTDFLWMSGGQDQPDAWMLKREKLRAGESRTFDSYDAFPGSGKLRPTGAPWNNGYELPRCAIDPRILLNHRQIWPADGWLYPNDVASVSFDLSIEIKQGDLIQFVSYTDGSRVNRGWRGQQTIAFEPKITYADGETHEASREFSGEQGAHGWRYQFIKDGKAADLTFFAESNQWRRGADDVRLFVGPREQRADVKQYAVRAWTFPKSGPVRITGMVGYTGDRAGSGQRPSERGGSATYAPWVSFLNSATQDGVFIGWDYFGHWKSSYCMRENGAATAQLNVAGFKQSLAPGQSIVTPKAFMGVFVGDLDNAGNAVLDWQYRHLWEYTRDEWFPDVRTLGAWWKGTSWELKGQDGTAINALVGGTEDHADIFQKSFRVIDWMRYTGTNLCDVERGWWDRAGDWNGPDFSRTTQYLRKGDMRLMLLIMPFEVDAQSKVAREHPDWLVPARFPNSNRPRLLDMSRPEVVTFIKGQLDSMVQRWGEFGWRNDDDMLGSDRGDDTPMLGQDQGMRGIIQHFLDQNPNCGFEACNGGGQFAGIDYTRLANSIQILDPAGDTTHRNYWAALLFPPDKTTIPQNWVVDCYDRPWRAHLSSAFAWAGDTSNRKKLEGIRELTDIYRYLFDRGVAGRWVRVYRPVVIGDDPTMFFQRLSRDAKRGVIITLRPPAAGALTIKPKGLLPNESYFLSFQESELTEQRSGASLMEQGITVRDMPPGELIYLNLPLHPGSKLDREAPKPPTAVVKRRGENMGWPGVELQWQPGSDNNWISFYEIIRGGVAIDKVARGTFYFDHSAGADLAAHYEVRTVDGAGNASGGASAQGPAAKPSRIVDDAPGGGIVFSPGWRHEKEDPLVAYGGTLTFTNKKGATAELTFEGKRVLWFTKLGTDNGTAAVSIDGGEAEIVDTYSADDIWGVAVYQKEFAAIGRHTLRIEVLSDRKPHPYERARNTFVNIDGIRIEPE